MGVKLVLEPVELRLGPFPFLFLDSQPQLMVALDLAYADGQQDEDALDDESHEDESCVPGPQIFNRERQILGQLRLYIVRDRAGKQISGVQYQ